MDLLGESGLLDHPRQVGSFNTPVAHRTGDSKTRCLRTRSRVIQELAYDLAQFTVLTAGENALGHQSQMSILGLEISQPGIGPTNIAGQNHFSKFLQRRPSRSSNSSASFGPHVPEA